MKGICSIERAQHMVWSKNRPFLVDNHRLRNTLLFWFHKSFGPTLSFGLRTKTPSLGGFPLVLLFPLDGQINDRHHHIGESAPNDGLPRKLYQLMMHTLNVLVACPNTVEEKNSACCTAAMSHHSI